MKLALLWQPDNFKKSEVIMFRIAIYDKNRKQQALLLDYIARDVEIEDDYETETFTEERLIRQRIEQIDFKFDLIFIVMSGKETVGLELAEYLRKHNVDIDIIFLADTADHIMEGFRYRAFNYLVGEIDYERFAYEMSQYLAEKRKYQKDYLSVSIHGKQQMIVLNLVKYFVSDVRKVIVYFQDERPNLEFYGKLNDIQSQLEEMGFLRCHQSYLVNMRKIERLAGDTLVIQDEELPISRKYAEHVKEQWNKFNRHHYDNNAKSKSLQQLSGDNSTVILTKNYPLGTKKYGILIGIQGPRQNDVFRLYHRENSYLGRDDRQCQIVIQEKTVSRRHCRIYFDEKEQCYYVCDYSSNGTYINNMVRLPYGEWTRVERDTLIHLTTENCTFLLG